MSDIDPRTAASPPGHHAGAVRLIFLYDGDDIRLLSRQPVDVLVPPADAPHDQSGFWVEVRAVSEDVLYRRVMTDPARSHLDVFPDDAASGTTPVPEPQAVGAFTVLVPNDDAASHVVLMGSPAQEIARFPIHEAEDGAEAPGP